VIGSNSNNLLRATNVSSISKYDESSDIHLTLQSIILKLEKIDDLESEINNLKGANDKSFRHRMSYLTWSLVNPIAVFTIPIAISLFIELWLNNFGKPIFSWEIESLTKSAIGSHLSL
jgi:hypothetical protein